MANPGFWSRLQEARLVRVVLVYLAAAWGILQFTSLLREELDLPRWLTPTAILVLLAGLVVVVFAAWAHSRIVTRRAAGMDVGYGEREIRLDDTAPAGLRVLSRSRLAATIMAGTLAVALLLGIARLGVLLLDRAGGLAPSEAVAEAAAPGIAVLPFTVRGEGLDVWREGMMDLISTNLDQVAGLRAIDSRTVLARWRDQVGNDPAPDLPTALEVARATRARYALVGNAVSMGPDVRLTADLYELDARTAQSVPPRSAWQGRVEGSPDSVLALVDRLSIDVLGAVLEQKEGEPGQVSLASVTTRSVPALKAYLEGEALLRGSEFEAAIAAFDRAVAADSAFGLAWYRLATARGWMEGLGGEGLAAMVRAARLADRLPPRDALLVRAGLALQRGTLDGLDSLTQVTARYPDDAEAWYLLGDTYHHLGDAALVERAMAADRAFDRTVALDPSFAPAYIHMIEDAWARADGARADSLVDLFERLVPPSPANRQRVESYRLMWNVYFGDSLASERALAALDTVPPRLATSLQWGRHPRLLEVQERVLLHLAGRPEPGLREGASIGLFFNHLSRGKLEAASRLVRESSAQLRGIAPVTLYIVFRLGGAVPEELYAPLLVVPPAVAPVDPSDFYGPGIGVFYAGAAAADREAWPEHERVVVRLRAYADTLLAGGDSTAARFAAGAGRALEAYGEWRRGRPREALPALQAAQREATLFQRYDLNFTIRWWIAELLLELGRPAEAEPYLRSLQDGTIALYRLGKVYEDLGRYPEARQAYELFALAYKDADPGLRPLADEARRSAARLTSVVRE